MSDSLSTAPRRKSLDIVEQVGWLKGKLLEGFLLVPLSFVTAESNHQQPSCGGRADNI